MGLIPLAHGLGQQQFSFGYVKHNLYIQIDPLWAYLCFFSHFDIWIY